MGEYKPGLVNGDIILKLESTIEQLKQERRLYEKQYHDLIFTNEKLNAELASLKKLYNDLLESHAKQAVEIQQSNAGELMAKNDIISLQKCNEELSDILRSWENSLPHLALVRRNKELEIQASNYAYESDRAKRDRDNAESLNEELKLLHQIANSSVDILSGEKSALESELLKAKELLRYSLFPKTNDHEAIFRNQIEEFLHKKQ